MSNKRNETQISYNLRNIETDLTLPKPKTEHLKRILGYSDATSYGNSLPQDLKKAESVSSFKNMITRGELDCI
jgi:hypothetical protein